MQGIAALGHNVQHRPGPANVERKAEDDAQQDGASKASHLPRTVALRDAAEQHRHHVHGAAQRQRADQDRLQDVGEVVVHLDMGTGPYDQGDGDLRQTGGVSARYSHGAKPG